MTWFMTRAEIKVAIFVFAILALLLTLFGCSSIQQITCNSSQPSAPFAGQWYNFGKCGAVVGVGSQFAIPTQGAVAGYVYEAPPALAMGKTITLNYSVTGYGALGVNDPADTPPASITLFIWEKGDNLQDPQHRWWCPVRGSLVMGINRALTCVIDGSWTNVNGAAAIESGNLDPGFTQALANPFGVGFTFGGANFYGHGVYVTQGQIEFIINSYTIN